MLKICNFWIENLNESDEVMVTRIFLILFQPHRALNTKLDHEKAIHLIVYLIYLGGGGVDKAFVILSLV